MLAGVYSFDSQWDPSAQAIKLAENSCWQSDMQLTNLWNDSQICCYEIQCVDTGIKTYRFTQDQREVLLYGVVKSPQETMTEILRRMHTNDSLHSPELEGMWVAVLYDRATQSISFATDQLGTLWLYVAIFEKGLMFCNDFRALVVSYPNAININWNAVMLTLSINHIPNNQTLFQEVQTLPPNSFVKVERGLLTELFQHSQFGIGDRYLSCNQNEKFQVLDSIWSNSREIWCSNAKKSVVPLSSGYDSRYVLAEVMKEQLPISCATFGHPGSIDVKGAKNICEQQGLPWRHFSPKDSVWNDWVHSVEMLGVTGGFQFIYGWADDWLQLLQKTGENVFLGFLGDALSGKHLVCNANSNSQDWMDNWEHWSASGGWLEPTISPLIREGAYDHMRDSIRNCWSGLVAQTHVWQPHQQAMYLDLLGRQRRFTASQVNLMGKYMSPRCPFLTQSHFEFWFNLPFEDLQKQSLYRAYGQSRFRDLFPTELAPTFRQRAVGTAKNFMVSLWPATKNSLLPSEQNPAVFLAIHKDNILSLVRQMASVIESIIDVAALAEEIRKFPQSSILKAGQLNRLVNMLIMLRLGISDKKRDH